MSKYWKDRTAKAQAALTKKSIKQIEKQLEKYYLNTSQRVIKEFENTYNKLKSSMAEGKEPTPAHLYKLDTYWSMQGQLKKELEKLGNKQIALLNKQFEIAFFDVYNSFALEGVKAFNTIDTAAVRQMLSQIWVADGKHYSQRIWDNTDLLLQTLNEELISTVAAGTKTTDLKKKLQERFNVAYYRADSVVRTELAHIQTQAAEQRYKDYGIQEFEVWADKDERRCKKCGKLHKKRYKLGSKLPVPAHPNCRCCIVPVVDED